MAASASTASHLEKDEIDAAAQVRTLEYELKMAKAHLAAVRRQRRIALDLPSSPEAMSAHPADNDPDELLPGQKTLFRCWGMEEPAHCAVVKRVESVCAKVSEVDDGKDNNPLHVPLADDPPAAKRAKRVYNRTPQGECPRCWRQGQRIPIGAFGHSATCPRAQPAQPQPAAAAEGVPVALPETPADPPAAVVPRPKRKITRTPDGLCPACFRRDNNLGVGNFKHKPALCKRERPVA